MNIVGSMLACGGITLQKLTHNKDDQKGESEKISMLCRGHWWLGVSCMTGAGLLEGWSLSFAALALIAPFSGLTVVFNTLVAVHILKERSSCMQIVAVTIILLGIACTSAVGPKDSQSYTVHQLVNMFSGCQYDDNNNGPISYKNGTRIGYGTSHMNRTCIITLSACRC